MFNLKSTVGRLIVFYFLLISQISVASIHERVSKSTKTIKHAEVTKYGTLQMEIHFDLSDHKLAERVIDIIKKDLIKIVDYFEYAPLEVVHFNIDQRMRLTNGNARNFPTNIINLYNFPANNNEHLIVLEDWWRGLIIHEFTHIIHLDQTRGFLEDGRKIFGTIAKIPVGVVPRWFSEGIAVWMESEVYKSGRLANALMNKELWLYLNDSSNCTKLDCLDEPGKYPAGQLSYWIGAAFMNYMESLRPKTIKCLVEGNSKAVPFFLNQSFINCTGLTVYEHFENFKLSYQKKYKLTQNEKSDVNFNQYGVTDYQKGIAIDEKRLFKVERLRDRELLVQYDLENEGNISLTQKFSHPISDIVGTVTLTRGSEEAEEDNVANEEALVMSFNEDPRYSEVNKVWKLINSETLTEERVLDFEDDPSYVLPISSEEFLTFSYQENRWHFRHVKWEGKEQDKERRGLVEFIFPSSDNLVWAKIINSRLVLKFHNYLTDSAKIIISDLDYQNPKQIYSSQNYFEIFGVTSQSFYLRENQQIEEFRLDQENVYRSHVMNSEEYAESDLLEMTFLMANSKWKLWLDSSLKVAPIKVANGMHPIPLLGTAFDAVETNVPLEEVVYDVSLDKKLEIMNYPRWEHFKPHYWFISFGNSDNLSSMGAMTTFSDPLFVHNFSIDTLYFDEIKKLGGSLSYSYDNHPYGIETSFEQDYYRSSISKTYVNRTRNFDLSLRFKIEKKRLTLIPSAFMGVDSTDDFLSSRKTTFVGGRGAISYLANSNYDFFRSFAFNTRMSVDTPDVDDSYFNFQNRLAIILRHADDLISEWRMTHGKLFKSDYSRGVLYAGGTSTTQMSRLFEYYGLPYGNAYGNELFTFRSKMDWNFYDVYRGYELWPVFLKDVHALAGVEALKSEVLFLDNKIFRHQMINSFFTGLKLKMNLFYFVPADIELILSSIARPDGARSGHAVINASAGF